jgi:Arc/MetJ-type ribon-helix-helix transcriptional regulator
MKTVSLRIPDRLDKQILGHAKKTGFSSKSEFIRYAIRRTLEPELNPEVIEQILKSRESLKRGKGKTLEQLEKELK